MGTEDIERAVGRLEGKIDQFFETYKNDQKEAFSWKVTMEGRVDGHDRFLSKTKVIGALAILAIPVFTVLVQKALGG